MKKILSFSVLCLLALAASASNVEYAVYNFNTLQPVNAANVTITNDTMSYSGLTNTDGIVTFSIMAPGNYSTNIIKSGYTGTTLSLQILNTSLNYVDDAYIYQNSNSGIIRLIVSDLTLTSHRICIYFDNSRLAGCYDANDTITLHNNLNYSATVVIEKTDVLSSPRGIKIYGGRDLRLVLIKKATIRTNISVCHQRFSLIGHFYVKTFTGI
jgi:hypothetical protein